MRLRSIRVRPVAGLIALLTVFSGCADDPESVARDEAGFVEATSEAAVTTADAFRFPDVVAVQSSRDDDGSWTFAVTLSSPYDSPERYADAWRVLGPDGTEYAIRVLAHDHAEEQPFTRSTSRVVIPDSVKVVTVEGRDLVNGWGGTTLEHALE